MEFFLCFVIFTKFLKVVTVSSDFKSLRNAFVDISEALSKQNHMVTIVLGRNQSKSPYPVKFGTIAGIPHAVVKFHEKFE